MGEKKDTFRGRTLVGAVSGRAPTPYDRIDDPRAGRNQLSPLLALARDRARLADAPMMSMVLP